MRSGATRGEQEVGRQSVSTVGPSRQGSPDTPAKVPMDSTVWLTRSDIGAHLGLSLRSIDRFIARHRLRSGSGRQVLIRLETYAWCLAGLRRHSTRSTAPVPAVRPDTRSPLPIPPGEELVLVAQSDGFNASGKALESLPSRCRVRTLDQCPADHWGWSLLEAAEAMAGVLDVMERGETRPEPAGDSPASRYLRQFLREAQASIGQRLDATDLARSLRRLAAGERQLLLEALSGEMADSARTDAGAPLEYAREPLLTEEELAREVRRTIATVRRWRVEGTGPVFLAIGRTVRYSRADVDHWRSERLVG